MDGLIILLIILTSFSSWNNFVGVGVFFLTERNISKEHYGIQNICCYPTLSDKLDYMHLAGGLYYPKLLG